MVISKDEEIMDIYLNTDPETLKKILIEKNFAIKWKKNHFSAICNVSNGRYHMLYLALNGRVFCDFHYDNKIHGIGLGADYGTKPESYFARFFKNVLNGHHISYRIHQVNWFTRKNKAIITGVRF
jgi:hypothetical protein